MVHLGNDAGQESAGETVPPTDLISGKIARFEAGRRGKKMSSHSDRFRSVLVLLNSAGMADEARKECHMVGLTWLGY